MIYYDLDLESVLTPTSKNARTACQRAVRTNSLKPAQDKRGTQRYQRVSQIFVTRQTARSRDTPAAKGLFSVALTPPLN
jgi:hypothetical protein